MAGDNMSDEEIMKEKDRLAAVRATAASQVKEMKALTEAIGKAVKEIGKTQSDLDTAIKEHEDSVKSLDI